jgi:GntR family transcriptional regulator/MocR family aminotransferase
MIELFIDASHRRGISAAIFTQLRDAVGSGRLAHGDRLPPTRELAAQLGVSRQTVTGAYERLAAEGFIEGRAGGGTFVTRSATSDRSRFAVSSLVPTNTVEREWRNTAAAAAGRDLRIGQPDPSLFPLVSWRRCMVSALQIRPSGYGDPAGTPELRAALAHWIGRSRGVDVTAEHIVVTAGAQHAVYLIARCLLRHGDTVAVEDPGYPPVAHMLSGLGLRVVGVPVDHEGIRVDRIPPVAGAVYVTPSHQSPTGASMSLARRRSLLTLAERHSMAILEDDYDSEYRHSDRPLEPLHRLDRSGRVLYIGTFSKTLSPSLRLGFVALPDSLVDAVAARRESIDWQTPTVIQDAMHRFIADGLLERHLRKVRRIYRERHGIVTAHVDDWRTHGLIDASPTSHAGLHVSLQLPSGVTEQRVARILQASGVTISRFAECGIDAAPPEGLLVGFGLGTTDELASTLQLVTAGLRNARPEVHRGPA